MTPRRCSIAALASASALALTACTPAPTLRAAWYQASDAKEVGEVSSVATEPLVIAVQNYGPDPVHVHGVSLDPPAKKTKAITSLPDFETDPDRVPELLSGGILRVRLVKGDVLRCALPVAVYVATGRKKNVHRLTLGGLPTFLSADLEDCGAKFWRERGAVRTEAHADARFADTPPRPAAIPSAAPQ